MMEASKDALSSNNLLQRCDDLQKLCDTIRTERNYSKRTIDFVMTTDSFLPSKRVRSVDKENTPKPIDEPTPESSPDVTLKPSLDREAFYKRLETYSTPFISKRRPVNAIQCAMHGFVDTHFVGGPKNNICKLSCTSCECTNFVIDISCFNPNIPKVQEIMQTYLKELSKSHRPGCFWKFDKCSDDIYAFPLGTSTEALNLIHTEGARLLSCEYSLPTIDHPLTKTQLEKLDIVIGTTENIPADHADTTILPDAKRIPYIIAMFGWRLDIQKGVHAFKCYHCFQTVTMEETRSFNVKTNHMEYCPWVNRTQAMVQRPHQGMPLTNADVEAIGTDNDSNNNENICGYEWMIGIVDLEYDFLFYMRESSLAYQESRLQWFKDARRRMAESRAALAMEFPDSPDSIPDQAFESMKRNAEGKDREEKEEVSVMETTKEGDVPTYDEAVSEERQQKQPSVDELSVIEQNTSVVKGPEQQEKEADVGDKLEPTTVVQPVTATQEEAIEQEEGHSKSSQEIEDELMDYMESEPEDEGDGEGEASATLSSNEQVKTDDKEENGPEDVDIDVSLLEDVQTPTITGISAGVSTPTPDQLEQQQEELDDTTTAIAITPATEEQSSTLPITEEIEKSDETLPLVTNDDENDKPLDQQQPEENTVLTPSVQIEEVDDELVDEEMGEATDESSVAPIIITKDGIEDVSPDHEKEITPVPDATAVIKAEDDQADKLVQEEEDVDEDSKFIRNMEQDDELEETKNEQVVEESPMVVLQDEKKNEEMEVLEQTVPQVMEETDGDAVVVVDTPQPLTINKDGEEDSAAVVSTEKQEMQEIQGTVSVSLPTLEQDDSLAKNDEKLQSPVSDSLGGLEEEVSVEEGYVDEEPQQPTSTDHTEKEMNIIEQPDDSTVIVQEIEDETTELKGGNNDNTSKATSVTVDEEEIATKEEAIEQVDDSRVSETNIIDTTEKMNDDDHVNDEQEAAVDTTTTPEIVELSNDDKDGSDTPIISINNSNENEMTTTNVYETKASEQTTLVENTDETTVDTLSYENIETSATKEEKDHTFISTPGPTTEVNSEEEQLKSLTENIGTPSSSQAVSTPQLLQSMEDALGQTPSSIPDTIPTSTTTTNDTQTTSEVTIETSLPQPETTVTSEEDTTTTMGETMTSTLNTTASIPKDAENEDAMVEDNEEEIVDSNVAGTDVEENQGGNGQESEVGVSGEKTEDMMDAMEEDQNEVVGEIVDEEMSNVEEDKGEVMEEVPTIATD
ncbi:hypothetical protein BDA99DRAFT_516734 [Phascolomyces articulosus]|uniref:C3HC-type domain-containing protein n=1 Tax=Phascolomyces articulosus TaxID=60185 RepID=A0AAD5K5Q7_9FUNG|nr:hypothetical protein BDA99DRAFT_516734 [Phascolomyces articulosus]